MNNNVNVNNNATVFRIYKGWNFKNEASFLKYSKKKDIIKIRETIEIKPRLYAIRLLDNHYRTTGRELSKQNIVDFLKNPRGNVFRKALNDHQVTVIANIYMKYCKVRNN